MTAAVKADADTVIRNLMGEPVQAVREHDRWRVETDALHPLFFLNGAVEEVTPAGIPEPTATGPVAF